MFTTVTGTTDLLPVVIVATLSAIVLVVSLVMGLMTRWFRAQIYNVQAFKKSSEPTEFVGVYRGHTFEVASAAPKVHQPANATASSSSHKFQQTSSSKQVPPPSSSDRKFKTDSKKKLPASSSEKPPVRQSQPSGSKQDKKDKSKSKHQSATPRNPLAKIEVQNERSRAEKPPQSRGQNVKPKNEVPAPKSILHTKLPPIPAEHNGSSSFLKLNNDNHTSRKLPDDNRTSPREIDDNYVSLKPGHGVSKAAKPKAPAIPQYVTEQEESESET
jgi:hypothetical protein